ncbi:MAG: SDR family NAD(P)-dependent oxidoreductase [Campylobacterales bacterium]
MRVLITGGTRGIGRELTERYLRRGAWVVVVGRGEEQLKELKRRWGPQLEGYRVDLANLEEATQFGKRLRREGRPIDIAIFNAGISAPHSPNFPPPELFEQIFRVNLLSIHRLLAETLELIPTGGKIVFISSLASIIASPTSLPYSASKRALNSYGESLYYLLRDREVITILPGFIKTDMTSGHQFKMPFLLELEEGVDRIERAIQKGIPFYPFPKRFYYLLKGLSLLPFPVKRWLIGKILKEISE